MTDNIKNISVARFNRDQNPEKHKASVALDACLEWLKELDQEPDHIIVIVGRNLEDNCSGTRFFQSGNFRYHSQVGLLMEGMNMIRDAG